MTDRISAFTEKLVAITQYFGEPFIQQTAAEINALHSVPVDKSQVDLIVEAMAKAWATASSGNPSVEDPAANVIDKPWLLDAAEQLWQKLSGRREVSDDEILEKWEETTETETAGSSRAFRSNLFQVVRWAIARSYPAKPHYSQLAISDRLESIGCRPVSGVAFTSHEDGTFSINSLPQPESETVKQLQKQLDEYRGATSVHIANADRASKERDEWKQAADRYRAENDSLKKQLAEKPTAWTREEIRQVAAKQFPRDYPITIDTIKQGDKSTGASIVTETIADAVLARQEQGQLCGPSAEDMRKKFSSLRNRMNTSALQDSLDLLDWYQKQNIRPIAEVTAEKDAKIKEQDDVINEWRAKAAEKDAEIKSLKQRVSAQHDVLGRWLTRLDKAGYGMNGKGNTLWSMVDEVLERLAEKDAEITKWKDNYNQISLLLSEIERHIDDYFDPVPQPVNTVSWELDDPRWPERLREKLEWALTAHENRVRELLHKCRGGYNSFRMFGDGSGNVYVGDTSVIPGGCVGPDTPSKPGGLVGAIAALEKLVAKQKPEPPCPPVNNEEAEQAECPHDNGLIRIVRERNRQKREEGWTAEHDQQHHHGELAVAAACYAVEHTSMRVVDQLGNDAWPWDREWDKRNKHPMIRRLEIAGALIAAEIDRLLAMNQMQLEPQKKATPEEVISELEGERKACPCDTQPSGVKGEVGPVTDSEQERILREAGKYRWYAALPYGHVRRFSDADQIGMFFGVVQEQNRCEKSACSEMFYISRKATDPRISPAEAVAKIQSWGLDPLTQIGGEG